MTGQEPLESTAQGLRAAADVNDWTRLEAIDRDAAALLSAAIASQDLSAGDMAGLRQLHAAHQYAQECCARELEKAGRHLADLQARKEGWISKARHTAALVYLPDGPRIVVVLTYRPGLDRSDSRRLAAAVASLARAL